MADSKDTNPFADEPIDVKDPVIGEPVSDAAKEPVKRRTKEEKLADDIEEAKTLLVENGYAVIEDGKPGGVPEGTPDDEFVVDAEKLPVNAFSNDVFGEIILHNGNPVLNIAPGRWVGPAPLQLGASQVRDLQKVLHDLEKGAR